MSAIERGIKLLHAPTTQLANAVPMESWSALLALAEWQESEIERLQAVLDRITDGAEWCGFVREEVAVNVCLWSLPHCDGRQGTLLEAANAAERSEG